MPKKFRKRSQKEWWFYHPATRRKHRRTRIYIVCAPYSAVVALALTDELPKYFERYGGPEPFIVRQNISTVTNDSDILSAIHIAVARCAELNEKERTRRERHQKQVLARPDDQALHKK